MKVEGVDDGLEVVKRAGREEGAVRIYHGLSLLSRAEIIPSREGTHSKPRGVPVFSPPPLKFRTAGFPQYGFKLEFNRDLHHDAAKPSQFIRGQSLVRPPPIMVLADKTSPRGEAKAEVPQDNPVQRSLARQRVMLSHRVNAYYDLIRASPFHSATYVFAVEPSIPSGRAERGSPF